MSRRHLAAAALVLSAALALTGCSAITAITGLFGGATRDDSGVITEGGDVDIFTIAVGDCLGQAPDGEVSSVAAVPCAEEHDGEVFHDFTLPDGDFPGEEAMESAAFDGCDAQFAPFVGASYEESTLDYMYYAPTEDSWNTYSDRVISCVLVDPAGPVTGSLQGAGR